MVVFLFAGHLDGVSIPHRKVCKPRDFGVVMDPKPKIPELTPGEIYEFLAPDARGGKPRPAFRIRFWRWAPGAEGTKHALFRHPTTGAVEAFREFDLQRVRRVL